MISPLNTYMGPLPKAFPRWGPSWLSFDIGQEPPAGDSFSGSPVSAAKALAVTPGRAVARAALVPGTAPLHAVILRPRTSARQTRPAIHHLYTADPALVPDAGVNSPRDVTEPLRQATPRTQRGFRRCSIIGAAPNVRLRTPRSLRPMGACGWHGRHPWRSAARLVADRATIADRH